MIFLFLILALITVIATLIFADINNEASKDLVRSYSTEAAEKFHSYIRQNLIIVRKVANSNAVTNWFDSEEYMARRTVAYYEMMDYANTFRDTRFSFGIQRSLNEYSVDNGTLLSDFFSNNKLDPSNPNNAWYFDCINSDNEFDLSIGKEDNIWYLWVKHKVMKEEEIVGVFCSIQQIQGVLYDMFKGYDKTILKGYVINRQGDILMDSATSEFYGSGNKSHISEVSSSPELASMLNEYSELGESNFSSRLEPKVIKLKQGAFGYVSFAPIPNSKWLVAIFIDSKLFFGAASIKNFLLLPLALLFAFFAYIGINKVLMKKLVFEPLSYLTQSVSKAEENGNEIFGSSRNDEIGELSRTIRDMRNRLSTYNWDLRQAAIKRMRQEQLLRTVNDAAVVMLSTTDEEIFETSIMDVLELMGHCVNVNSVHVFHNETIDDELYYVHIYEWLSSSSHEEETIPTGEKFPYSKNLELKNKLLRGEHIKGPISQLMQNDQYVISSHDVKSILVIPLLLQNKFLGFFSFVDNQQERDFDEDEIDILRSTGLIIFSAINRNAQTAQIREAHEREKLVLESLPLCCFLMNKDLKVFYCNDEAVKLFKLKDKQEFSERFLDLSPEYQSNNQLSIEKGRMYFKKAIEEGRCVFEMEHQMLDGTPVPAGVTLVRVAYDSDYVVAGYLRDLREHKQMMKDIEHRDNLLSTVNLAATSLLQSDIDEFEINLWRSMGMMAKTVDVDYVYIWKNYVINDGELRCTRLYEWSDAIELLKHDRMDKSYKDMVLWKEKLSSGLCINGMVKDLPNKARAFFASKGTQSILVLPVFLQDQFWGFVGFEDYRHERVFSENDESILRSASLLIANVLLRNEMTLNVRDTAAKLEAVISNYAGIIWSVDRSNVVTLLNGLYIKELGIMPAFFEGWKLNAAQKENQHLNIISNVEKTFAEGPQDWITEVDGKIFHVHTTPIFDGNNCVTDVVGSIDDVTKTIRLQKELEVALKEAQEANNAKSYFLARMSHEMRTPLNAVIGLTELTIDAKGLSDVALSNLQKIYNSGKMLLNTVNDILDISKIEAGKFDLVLEEYSLASLINDAVTQSIMHIGEKPVKFVMHINENLFSRLYGDELKIKQILNNLLSNSFKYTREGAVELSVSCDREGDAVWLGFQVNDTGIGIKPENLSRLFTDYSQLDTKYNRKIEGIGLGLSITKRLAEMMGGSITAESEYGKGSVFTVRLRQKFVSDAAIGSDIVESLKNFNYSDNKLNQYSRLVRINTPYARVLVVDDIVTNLDVAKGMLKPYQMQIDCVTSGQEAIDLIREENVRYNAIFMDHMMPGLDGIETTRIIREEIGTEYAKTVPIIALTANAISGNEEMFLSKGFQAFLSKPIEFYNLDKVVQRWVRDKKQERILAGPSKGRYSWSIDMRNGQDRRIIFDRRSGVDRRDIEGRISGLDMNKGLERFGSEESYLEVLRSYAANTPPLLKTAKEVNENNLADYAIAVHGIKGSSRGICADIAASVAEALEKAAKVENFDFVNANNMAFVKTIENLVEQIEDMLDEIAKHNPKPKKDKPEKELLLKLLSACENYDIDEIDTAITEIKSFEYVNDNELVAWLRENVDQMNYAQIVEKLLAITNSNTEVQNG